MQALSLSEQAKTHRFTLQVVHGFARYLAMTGVGERAAALLCFVTNEPGYPRAASQRSQEVLAELSTALTTAAMEQARRKAAQLTLEQVVAELDALTDGDAAESRLAP